ncbi:MAG: DNA polymerase I [Clostridiales bacterium]|nr:DNA polymerase I [Clostridiales bacterium]
MKRIIVIDSHSIIHKMFFGVRPLHTASGIPTNAVFGFVNILFKLINDYAPNMIYAAFDVHAPTFRHKMYSEYKAGRDKTAEDLLVQIDMMKDILRAMGIPVFECPGFEADDILGSISSMADNENMETLLLTGDRDSFQLITDKTNVLYSKHTGELEIYNREKFEEAYSVLLSQFVDLKALMGDSSDNIPGVAGVGPKTATALINEYGDLDNIYDNVDKIKSASLKEKLLKSRDNAFMSRELARIVKTAPVELGEVRDSAFEIIRSNELHALLTQYELKSAIKHIFTVEQMDFEINEDSHIDSLTADEAKKYFSSLTKESGVAVFNGEQALDTGDDATLVVSANGGKCFYIADTYEKRVDAVADFVLGEHNAPIYINDIKQLYHDIEGIRGEVCGELSPTVCDISIASYIYDVLNPRSSSEYILSRFLNSEDKKDLYKACTALFEELQKKNLLRLYTDIEQPLIRTLYLMEREGFRVDKEKLYELDKRYSYQIDSLIKEIYTLAGEEFNINSPKQLGVILFERLGLPVIKKTKTGYSTNAEVLEQLEGEHPIIEKILEYRALAKLKSTYVDGLLAVADSNSFVHTSFRQNVTATGRLSSTEPNLQNIPVRSERGREIREVFLPSGDDFVLVDADYSQIELRIFAHMSGDKNFIASFERNEDIHTRTASEVFGVAFNEVTPFQRSAAKAVNFGIIYGISDVGLSKSIHTTRREAKQYIDKYFENYPSIKAYMDESIANARKNGYCATLFERRRDIPDIDSRNFNIRSAAERIAVNMPVQGTAADVIKIAMNGVRKRLERMNMKSRLILQVHDELIIDAHREEVEAVKALLKEEMESAAALSVKLVADVNVGENWGEAK